MITKSQRQQITKAILKNLDKTENIKIFIFGSQANGKATERSDIDIGIIATTPISLVTMNNIKDDVNNLAMINKFDIIDFNTVTDDFKEIALQTVEILYEQ